MVLLIAAMRFCFGSLVSPDVMTGYPARMSSAVIEDLQRYGPQNKAAPMSFADADVYTHDLARRCAENFTVVSWLLPRRLRAPFRHVYAFCRWADDLGDEAGRPSGEPSDRLSLEKIVGFDTERGLELLAWWRQELDACFAGAPRHPVFVALAATIEAHDLPRDPFADLISAFEQDQRVTRYETYDQLLDYCTRSADPVGRLVLLLAGVRDEASFALSDQTCTALQLVNFWQDVHRDVLERDRIYLPADVAAKHGVDLTAMAARIHETRAPFAADAGYRAAILDLCDRAAPLFERGRALLPRVPADVRADVRLFSQGGEAVLRAIRAQGGDTLIRRPVVPRRAKLGMMVGALTGVVTGRLIKRNDQVANPKDQVQGS